MPGCFLHWAFWPCSCTSWQAWDSWVHMRARLATTSVYSARKSVPCRVSARHQQAHQSATPHLPIPAACTTAARCASPAVPCCLPPFLSPYHQRRLFRRICHIPPPCAGHSLPAQRTLRAARPRSPDPLCLTQPLWPLDGDIHRPYPV